MTGVAIGAVQIEVDGQGPPIVLVHGLGGTSNTFQPILEHFAGYRCLRPDLPGSGRSARPYETLTLSRMISSVIEVITSVAGAPAHVVGHSLGTLVAQHVAVEAAEWVRSLTLFGPIIEPSESARERLRARAQDARRQGLIAIADAVAASALSSASRTLPLAVAFLRESHMRQDVEGFAQSCEALAEAKAADWRLIRCPMLIVTGEEDGVGPPSVAQTLADTVKGARVKILDRCGHWTPLERPKDCGRLAADFIRSLET